MRFKKFDSLCLRREFLLVQRGGARFSSRVGVLMVKPNALGTCRVGFTVSRKVGNAVVRNRVKRRLRDVVCREAASLCLGCDHVFVSYAGIVRTDYRVLREIVQGLLEQAGQWASDSRSW